MGKLTVLRVNGAETVEDYMLPPPLEVLQSAVGGSIELVPHWTNWRGEPAAAFIHGEGKLVGLEMNGVATAYWYFLLGRSVDDYLVGNVAIVSGDEGFMALL